MDGRTHEQTDLVTMSLLELLIAAKKPLNTSKGLTGCPKKHVTLFVKAVIFRPRIARGWYYTHFEADPLRLETSTHTSHRCR